MAAAAGAAAAAPTRQRQSTDERHRHHRSAALQSHRRGQRTKGEVGVVGPHRAHAKVQRHAQHPAAEPGLQAVGCRVGRAAGGASAGRRVHARGCASTRHAGAASAEKHTCMHAAPAAGRGCRPQTHSRPTASRRRRQQERTWTAKGMASRTPCGSTHITRSFFHAFSARISACSTLHSFFERCAVVGGRAAGGGRLGGGWARARACRGAGCAPPPGNRPTGAARGWHGAGPGGMPRQHDCAGSAGCRRAVALTPAARRRRRLRAPRGPIAPCTARAGHPPAGTAPASSRGWPWARWRWWARRLRRPRRPPVPAAPPRPAQHRRCCSWPRRPGRLPPGPPRTDESSLWPALRLNDSAGGAGTDAIAGDWRGRTECGRPGLLLLVLGAWWPAGPCGPGERSRPAPDRPAVIIRSPQTLLKPQAQN